MKKVSSPTQFKGAHEMPYCTVSVSDMSWNATGTWRYLRPRYIEQIPACQASCPAAEPIEKWITLSQKGKFNEAWEILTTENPFPGLMGRVCFHPCERGCNRKDVGGSVTINMLERYLADQYGYNHARLQTWAPSSGKSVAIVGSGPAGLSAAYFLARLGHTVTVFERFEKPGGLFRYGIPEYRLPKNVLDKELKKIYDLGVTFKYGKTLQKDDITGLQNKFDAVFVAIGAHVSKKIGVEGEDANGVVPALEFLENVQFGVDCESSQDARCEVRGAVVVIGGGNSAIDAARTAIRTGSKDVTILYRRSRTEMPALEDEIIDAVEEGVKLELLAAPKKILSENGRVVAIECIRMKLGAPDSSGRKTPEPIAGSEFTIKADLVLAAIGETVVSRQSLVVGDQRPNDYRLFFGGDIIEDTRTVVSAVGSAKRAAIEIDCMLRGVNYKDVFEKIRIPETNIVRMKEYLGAIQACRRAGVQASWRSDASTPVRHQIVRTEHLNTYYFEPTSPSKYPKRGVSERKNSMYEVHLAPDKNMADTQLSRCMHCGCCTECDNCFIYCPDVSITKKPGGYDIEYEFCKGCGVCVKECPRAAMEMIEEPTEISCKKS